MPHLETAKDWLVRVLGAVPFSGRSRGLHDFQMGALGHADPSQAVDPAALVSMLWLGGKPLALFAPSETDRAVAGFLDRYGPGVHSLAWTIDDLWAAESLLRRAQVRITGTDIGGRHFFMHPRDTAGVFMEWTDSYFSEDPRDGHDLPAPAESTVSVRDIAWVTAVVRDVQQAAETLGRLLKATPTYGDPASPTEHEDTLDLAIGDVVLRLVAPRSSRSVYADALDASGERLHSFCLGVADLAETATALDREGIKILSDGPGMLRTDPESTLGVQLEWTDSSPTT